MTTPILDAKRLILTSLRHGALNPQRIAQETELAPFSVNAWLKDLKRERLVEERLTTRVHEFRLTTRGHEFLAMDDQLRLIR